LQQSLKTLELLRKAGEDVTEEFQETLEEQQGKAKSVDKTKIIDSKNHRDKTLFSEIGIQIGTILTYIYAEKIICKVISDKKVKYKNKEWTISRLAVSLVGYRVSGYKYFKYDGETLWDRRKRLEKEKKGLIVFLDFKMKKLLSLYFIMLLLFFNACDMLTTADVEFSERFMRMRSNFV
jgi:hypothetical protein